MWLQMTQIQLVHTDNTTGTNAAGKNTADVAVAALKVQVQNKLNWN